MLGCGAMNEAIAEREQLYVDTEQGSEDDGLFVKFNELPASRAAVICVLPQFRLWRV